MRLDKKILRKRCREPAAVTCFLSLSGLNLECLENLNPFQQLQWLIVSDNALQSDEGIKRLKQLWYLDLSNNKIRNINCLSKFLALGTLVLSNNNLKWADLERLSHAHIMSLSLHGNPQLDSDPYYRIHVIDSLPLVWELDGRLVTVTERLHVKQFFIDTQLTDHPVRHKTCKTFQTTSLKNIGTEGVVSKECKYIYSKFPMSEKHTKHTDERRLIYLCNMVQEDIKELLDQANTTGPMNDNFLNDLLRLRYLDVERCNMVLLLLVITLEFRLPTGLVRATLVSAQLDMIGNVSTMSLFLLPREHRARVVSILLNAAKVDRDNNIKNEGGLYPQLFMCLYYTVAQLTWIRQTSRDNMKNVHPISHTSDYMALMASEAVSLMVQNTKFCSYFTTSQVGLIDLVTSATGSVDIVLDIKDKLLDAGTTIGGPDQEVYEAINNMIMEAIEVRLSRINIKMSDIPVGDRYLSLSDSLPIKPLHSVIWASTFLSNGKQVPRTDPPILRPAREAMKPKPAQPQIGEKVLLGPQVVGELTMLMEGDVAMARIDEVPVANGAVVRKLKSSDAHFTFVDMKSLCYGKDIGMWRPIKTIGDNHQSASDEDRYSIHSTEPNEAAKCKYDHDQRSARDGAYSAPLIYTPKDAGTSAMALVQQRSLGPRNSKGKAVRPKSSGVQDVRNSGLSDMMVRRVMSANDNSNSNHLRNNPEMREFRQSLMQDNLLMGGEMTNVQVTVSNTSGQPKQSTTAAADEQQKKKRIGSGLSCSSLHQHDNVHYIHGFTPREDSSRSNTISILATPVTSERQTTAGRDTSCSKDEHLDEIVELAGQGELEKQIADQDENPVSTSTPKGDHKAGKPEDKASTSGKSIEDVDSGKRSTPKNDQQPDDASVREHGGSPRSRREIGGFETEKKDESSPDVNSTHSHSVPENGVVGENDDKHSTTVVSDAAGRDDCPVCIAMANGTLVKAVQGNNDQNPAQTSDVSEKENIMTPNETNTLHTPGMETNGEQKLSNMEEAETEVSENAENVEPPIDVRETTLRQQLSTNGGLRVTAGVSTMPRHERPKSAVESYNYYVIQQPQVFASGISAKMNERNANNGFKTDFQQQREEAWRRTTRNRRQRPLTATIMTSSQYPPPQRPSSPSPQQEQHHQVQFGRDPRLRITKADRWLGGGRDLYWESVRKRPKSGHTPGWKEGLPDSMRKRRPMSAYVTPLTPRQYTARSITSTSCGYLQQELTPFDSNYPRESGGRESVLFMPHARAIQLSQEFPPSRQLTTPVSDDEQHSVRPSTVQETHVNFMETKSTTDRPLAIEGVPPPSIPNPSKRYSSRYDMMMMTSYSNLDYISEDDEAGYEGRPSSQLSFNNDPDLQTYYNSSPRLLIPVKCGTGNTNNGHFFQSSLLEQPNLTHHAAPDSIDSNTNGEPSSTKSYKLCPLHRGMVFPYYNYNNNVIAQYD